jgi:hypothetical protein
METPGQSGIHLARAGSDGKIDNSGGGDARGPQKGEDRTPSASHPRLNLMLGVDLERDLLDLCEILLCRKAGVVYAGGRKLSSFSGVAIGAKIDSLVASDDLDTPSSGPVGLPD